MIEKIDYCIDSVNQLIDYVFTQIRSSDSVSTGRGYFPLLAVAQHAKDSYVSIKDNLERDLKNGKK